jgi:hypothetical protein
LAGEDADISEHGLESHALHKKSVIMSAAPSTPLTEALRIVSYLPWFLLGHDPGVSNTDGQNKRSVEGMNMAPTSANGNVCGGETARNTVTIEPVIIVLLLSGCAVSPAPQDIGASYVSSIPYQSWSCAQLHQEQSSLKTVLANASTQEEQIRSDERVHSAVSMLIPLPPDTGSTNITSQMEIAHLKGAQNAIKQALAYNSCPTGDLAQTSFRYNPVVHQ